MWPNKIFKSKNNDKMSKSAIFLGFSHIAPQPDFLPEMGLYLFKRSGSYADFDIETVKIR